MSESSGSIRSSVDDRICTITIDNEAKRNAFDFAMMAEMREVFETLEGRDEHVIVVITGAGDQAFSAGFDLSIDRGEQSGQDPQLWSQMIDGIEEYSYPVIAMINGDTYGGAVEVSAACDIRIGVDDAHFGITPAKIGLVYGGHAINRVMDLIGPAKTKELLFTGEPIPADHAYEVGLLNYAVNREKLEEKTYDMAENMAGNAPFSLRKMKEIVNITLEKGRVTEAEEKWIQHLRNKARETDDYAEGVAAFREGREPEFGDH